MNTKAAINKALGIARSKYGNKRSRCLLNHEHDSRAESDWCNILLGDLKKRKIAGYQVQVHYEVFPGIMHVVDFEVHYYDKTVEVQDVKGMATSVWRMKYKMFCIRYPLIKYVIVQRKDGVWTKVSKKVK